MIQNKDKIEQMLGQVILLLTQIHDVLNPHPTPTIREVQGYPRLRWDRNVSEDSPVVYGTWVTVDHITQIYCDNYTITDILRTHPEILEEDIREALQYAIRTKA